MDFIILPQEGLPPAVGQDVNASHVVRIVHQRRDVHQQNWDQGDEEQDSGCAENAPAESAVLWDVYRVPP
ncbi:MAG: hypothetical protein AMXMBFR67_14650 [Nitrospira sp.]